MTLNTVTPQEQVMIDYVKQCISNNHTIKLALDHQLIKLDYTLSIKHTFLRLPVYIGETATVIDTVDLPIRDMNPLVEFDTVEKLQASVVRRLKRLVTLSDSMLDLEQTIISNYNNKLIEY